MNNLENKTQSSFSFIAGVAAGAVLGILFAPESGEKTRKKLKQSLVPLISEALSEIEEKKAEVNKVKHKTEKIINNAIEDLAEKSAPTQKELVNSLGNIEKTIEKEKKSVLKKISKK